jgi:hypothetical protein
VHEIKVRLKVIQAGLLLDFELKNDLFGFIDEERKKELKYEALTLKKKL